MIGAKVTAVTSGISANLVERLGEFAYYFIGAYDIVVWIAHLIIRRESKPAAIASKRETHIKAVGRSIGAKAKFGKFDRSQSTRPESRLTCGHVFTGTQP
jgi:hypothetical protein